MFVGCLMMCLMMADGLQNYLLYVPNTRYIIMYLPSSGNMYGT